MEATNNLKKILICDDPCRGHVVNGSGPLSGGQVWIPSVLQAKNQQLSESLWKELEESRRLKLNRIKKIKRQIFREEIRQGKRVGTRKLIQKREEHHLKLIFKMQRIVC